MGKIICIDSSTLFFPAVFSWERQTLDKHKGLHNRVILPPQYYYFNSMLSCLKKIGVEHDDMVIITLEGKSWRKDYSATYKAQRAGDRAKHTLINWDKTFENLNNLNTALDQSTDWHFIREWKSESDDICAMVPKVFKDKQCVIVTGDKDLHQLAYWPNVLIFNVNKKCKGSKGMYEKIENPLKILADKVRLGDVSDNILVDKKNDKEEDVELRRLIIDLLKLPDYIEEAIKEILENLPEKETNLNELPPFKGVKEKFMKIYNKDNIITPEYCYALQEKRDAKKLKIKQEKAEAKKKEMRALIGKIWM